ncbi:MAG: hypothetical protein J4G16_09760 [Acidobacteria bacterium]|nr:hypothetical protein [Acidobacteriota bacterium]
MKIYCTGKTRILTVVLCVLLSAGCDSDGSSPVAPTPQPLGPPGTADVAGTWTATLTASSGDITGGGCLGNVARGFQLSRTWTATLTVAQDGTTLTPTSVEIAGVTCSFGGSVSSNTVNATVNSCTPDRIDVGAVEVCGSDPWHLESLSLAVEATVSGSVVTGTPTATATAVSGDASHSVSATGTLSMSR